MDKLAPKTKHFVLLALVPALAILIPWGYLLWDEANRYGYSLWDMDIFTLIAAPFVGYSVASFLFWFMRERIKNKPWLYWVGISLLGSILAISIRLIYFYSIADLPLGWKRTVWTVFLFAGGLTIYSSVFTAAYFYTITRRTLKEDAETY